MNKAFERIGFMLIGVILTSVAYLIGAADSGDDAKPIGLANGVFDTLRCRQLIVGASESEQGVVIGTQTDAVGTIAYITLSSEDSAIYIEAQPHATIFSMGQTGIDIGNYIDIGTSQGVARLEMATFTQAIADSPPGVEIRSGITEANISVDGRKVMPLGPPSSDKE